MFTTNQTASQHIGSRTHQADATAHHDDPDTGHRAWVLLDGIGDREHTAAWTRSAAPALAELAAELGDGHAAIQRLRPAFHTERATMDYPKDWPPDAAAIVAVLTPTGRLNITWAGDCRAYLAERDRVQLLTTDHNKATEQRREGRWPEPDAHDHLTSSLCFLTGVVDTVTVDFDPRPDLRRLVLASDGAYLPHETFGALPPPSPDGSHRHREGSGILTPLLAGDPETVARRFTDLAVRTDPAPDGPDNASVLVIDLNPTR
ncbi:PP2C family protein-serine/threonine phosphatase [Kitasatospora sp. NPDC101183]|uniref:PP2C family protein-serine/threonine phosphatase n=1 Tax=Kitasatospora sp. NPDC101183 TaxID=3364100 RepID=UPI003803C42D